MGASSSVSESSTSSQSSKNDAHNVKLKSESGTSGVPHSTTSSKAQEEKSTETSEFRGNPELKRLVVAMQSEVIELEQRLSQVSTEADSSRRELNVAFAFFLLTYNKIIFALDSIRDSLGQDPPALFRAVGELLFKEFRALLAAVWLFDRESGELELWAQKQHNDMDSSFSFATTTSVLQPLVDWTPLELRQRIPQYSDLHLWISTNATAHESDDDLEIYQLEIVPPVVTTSPSMSVNLCYLFM